jgi:hypothetical protein
MYFYPLKEIYMMQYLKHFNYELQQIQMVDKGETEQTT